MQELELKCTLTLWMAFTNYLRKDPYIGKDAAQLAVFRLLTKLDQEGISNVDLIISTEFTYTLKYECEGIHFIKQFSKEEVDSVNVKQILNI